MLLQLHKSLLPHKGAYAGPVKFRQKWMNFYTKALSKFVGGQGLRLTLNVEVSGRRLSSKGGGNEVALQELGLNDDVTAGKCDVSCSRFGASPLVRL